MIEDARTIFRVRNAAQLRERAEKFMRKRGHPTGVNEATKQAEPLPAYVNWGRWLVDCPCGSGAIASVADEEAICFECGSVHRVTFPPAGEVDEAVVVLAQRPVKRRNWEPAVESVAFLIAENDVAAAIATDVAVPEVGAEPEGLAELTGKEKQEAAALRADDERTRRRG